MKRERQNQVEPLCRASCGAGQIKPRHACITKLSLRLQGRADARPTAESAAGLTREPLRGGPHRASGGQARGPPDRRTAYGPPPPCQACCFRSAPRVPESWMVSGAKKRAGRGTTRATGLSGNEGDGPRGGASANWPSPTRREPYGARRSRRPGGAHPAPPGPLGWSRSLCANQQPDTARASSI